MDLLTNFDALSETLIGVGALLGLFVGFWRWVRPRTKRVAADANAVRDVLLGRDAIFDSITGRELAPALPGIGQRTATLEHAVTQLADQQVRLDDLDRRVGNLEQAASAPQTVVRATVNVSPSEPAFPELGEN